MSAFNGIVGAINERIWADWVLFVLLGVGILFTIWSLIASFSDAALKPLLLGRGIEIPVGVILIGAIGGLVLHGLIGLFVGAVVFSIGYRLWGAWMHQNAPADAAGAVQKS
jgi:predicted PurR-regulated permease PerM